MLTEADIKKLIYLDIKEVTPQLMISLVKHYIFDKKQESIEIKPPVDQIALSASTLVGKFIFDTDLLNYYYCYAKKFYLNKYSGPDSDNTNTTNNTSNKNNK